jgi:hypothetical protein
MLDRVNSDGALHQLGANGYPILYSGYMVRLLSQYVTVSCDGGTKLAKNLLLSLTLLAHTFRTIKEHYGRS